MQILNAEYYDVDNLADQLDVGSRELIIALGQIKGDIIEWNESGIELAFRFKVENKNEIRRAVRQMCCNLNTLYRYSKFRL